MIAYTDKPKSEAHTYCMSCGFNRKDREIQSCPSCNKTLWVREHDYGRLLNNNDIKLFKCCPYCKNEEFDEIRITKPTKQLFENSLLAIFCICKLCERSWNNLEIVI